MDGPSNSAGAREIASRQRWIAAVKRVQRRQFHRTIKGRARLERDVHSIQTFAPALELRIDESNLAILEGPLTIDLGHESFRSVRVRIVFPPDYPKREPWVFDAEKLFQPLSGKPLADRHLSEDGWCCLQLVSGWDGTDPNAFVMFMRNVVTFFDRQFLYDVLGRWPGSEWAHNEAAWVQYAREELAQEPGLLGIVERFAVRGEPIPSRKSLCACGSGQPFLLCHRAQVKRIIADIPLGTMTSMRRKGISLLVHHDGRQNLASEVQSA